MPKREATNTYRNRFCGTPNLANGFVPKLDSFIVAYGGSRDGELQRKAMEITAEHAKTGLFKVTVWSWDDIIARALDYPQVIQKLLVHNEVPTVTALDPKRPKGDIRQELEAATLPLFPPPRAD